MHDDQERLQVVGRTQCSQSEALITVTIGINQWISHLVVMTLLSKEILIANMIEENPYQLLFIRTPEGRDEEELSSFITTIHEDR